MTAVAKALRFYIYGEGSNPGYAVLRALIAKKLLNPDGTPTNLGRDVAGEK